jgi:hypothetical protein
MTVGCRGFVFGSKFGNFVSHDVVEMLGNVNLKYIRSLLENIEQ